MVCELLFVKNESHEQLIKLKCRALKHTQVACLGVMMTLPSY
jgi:hypothetical protein